MREKESPTSVLSLLGLGTLLLAVEPAGAQEYPPGVTPERVRAGSELFGNGGRCGDCHGEEGRGIPGLGSDLTDDRWEYADGSFEGILEVVRRGVPAERTAIGLPMPPSGGARLTDGEEAALAAYVWSLSN